MYKPDKPLDILPNELLLRIFHALGDASRVTGKSQALAGEIVVTHVCGLWRELALSTPSLWNIFQHDGLRGCVSLERLRAYIERSRNLPLELFFHFTTTGEDGSTDDLEDGKNALEMFNLVAANQHRCRQLHIFTENEEILYYFQDYFQDVSAPMLEAFTLCADKSIEYVEDWDQFEDWIWDWDPNAFLSGSRALKYVRLDRLGLNFVGPNLNSVVELRLEANPDPDHLPSLTIDYPVFNGLLALPNIETLSIWGLMFKVGMEFGAEPRFIQAKSLKHFRLSARGWIGHYFLSNVSAPSLETITLETHLFTARGLARTGHFFPSLHTLALIDPYHLPTADSRFLEIMEVTRKIKRLVLSDADYPRTHSMNIKSLFLTMMAKLGEAPGNIWPELEEATLSTTIEDLENNCPQIIQAHPNLKRLLVTPGCLDETTTTRWSVPETVRVEGIDKADPLIPVYWRPGPTSLESAQDPFLACCEQNTNANSTSDAS
ncbi:hypothetical protein DFP72DRAFT_888298 [Ephemerocybe angulata]|uniref:F-box domain-containing protein n=1 Tax=Ephemerocybe angulata TaxID=980116 RepID=A0A8H6I3E6_9AGAR|nr:hypothetical protein DFP72DRAFT_888298 [Tulosesus angulatus]